MGRSWPCREAYLQSWDCRQLANRSPAPSSRLHLDTVLSGLHTAAAFIRFQTLLTPKQGQSQRLHHHHQLGGQTGGASHLTSCAVPRTPQHTGPHLLT